MLTVESPTAAPAIRTLYIKKDRLIAAPMALVFETLLDPPGPLSGQSLKLEAWPGGRWFRDLGNNAGHLWGHVQVIMPPKLLEITGCERRLKNGALGGDRRSVEKNAAPKTLTS